MGCCGRTYRTTKVAKDAPIIVSLQSLVKMHYTGLGTLNWYIGITGAKYEFGLLRMTGYVDGRDVSSLLDYIEDGKKVFEVLP